MEDVTMKGGGAWQLTMSLLVNFFFPFWFFWELWYELNESKKSCTRSWELYVYPVRKLTTPIVFVCGSNHEYPNKRGKGEKKQINIKKKQFGRTERYGYSKMNIYIINLYEECESVSFKWNWYY